jgi:multisubunit Na+/H+ antiporter MnhG subunit
VKTLLTASALIEAATGLALVAFPSLADTPVALTVARTAGVALLALGVACWCARIAEPGPAVRGVLRAMALYNVGIVALLLYAGLGVGLSSVGLWPAALIHAFMGAWCAKIAIGDPGRDVASAA